MSRRDRKLNRHKTTRRRAVKAKPCPNCGRRTRRGQDCAFEGRTTEAQAAEMHDRMTRRSNIKPIR